MTYYNVIIKSSKGFLKYRNLGERDFVKLGDYLVRRGVSWEYMNAYKKNRDGSTSYAKRIYNN